MEDTGTNRIMVEDFNTPFVTMGRTIREINMGLEQCLRKTVSNDL